MRVCVGMRWPLRTLFTAMVGFALFQGCKGNSSKAVQLPKTDTLVEQQIQPSATPNPEPTSQDVQLTDNGVTGRQRKSIAELRASIVNCVGAGRARYDANDSPVDPSTAAFPPILEVREKMFLGQTLENTSEGRRTFLLNDDSAKSTGKDILEVEAQYLEAPASTLDVRATGLEDLSFLNALKNVSFVVAFNCNVASGNSETPKCTCSTPEEARSLLERCLPLLDPATEKFNKAVEVLASKENCGSDDFFNRRRAIASLISSYAFATSR